jgi:hypothetical protein
MLANQIQQCIKLSMQYDQVELIPDMKSSWTFESQLI